MRYLPESIKEQLSGQPLDLHRLEYFYEQQVVGHYTYYGLGHFVLAVYAALPALLTSDLLHKIWLNFKYYEHQGERKTIHPIAPADILLSSLLEEVSPGYYQMPELVRQALLRYWDQCRKGHESGPIHFEPLDQIAEFLRDYARFDFSEGAIGDQAFREAQEWTADSYLDPAAALHRVSQAYQVAGSEGERLRYQDALNKMAGRLSLSIAADDKPLADDGPFQPLVALSRAMQAVADKQPEAYREFLDKTSPELLSDLPSSQPGHISIRVPDQLQRNWIAGGGKEQVRTETMTWALVVGIGGPPKKQDKIPPPDEAKTDQGDEGYNDAFDMATCLQRCLPAESLDLKLLLRNEATKQAILGQLQRIADHCAPQDHIIVYFSAYADKEDGHCFLRCSDSLPLTESRNEKSTYLWDEDFLKATKNIVCGRITLLLEAQFSASPYWIDLDKGHVLFANCRQDQSAYILKNSIGEKSRSPFTYTLTCRLLAGRDVSLQSLFNDTLRDFYALKPVQKTYGPETVFEKQNPQLFAGKDALHSPFFFNHKPLPLLQRRLRQAGYYDGDTHGVWTAATAAGFSKFLANRKAGNTGSKQDYIAELEGQIAQRSRAELPVFLLVFCDPHKKAVLLEEERKQIEHLLEPYQGKIQIVTLATPSVETLRHQFCSANMRDRIELFYFSGFGEKPELELDGGSLSPHEFLTWLPFQERLQVAIINRCKSDYLAERLSQAGVKVAVGAPVVISEQEAMRAGVSLLEGLLRGADLDKILDDLNPKTR